jgi:hypothetical protein
MRRENRDSVADTIERFLDGRCNTLHGLEASVDGLVPGANPFADHGAYNPDENGLRYSQLAGEITEAAEVPLAILCEAGARTVRWLRR